MAKVILLTIKRKESVFASVICELYNDIYMFKMYIYVDNMDW